MHSNIKNLIQETTPWFYSWLIKKNPDYDGGCPCFSVTASGLDIDCSCWRGGGQVFKYSGLWIRDLENQYSAEDLETLCLHFLKDIATIWSNTDWEYKINDLPPKCYNLQLE